MKNLLGLLVFFFCCPISWAQESIILEDFNHFKIGKFNTSGWYIRDEDDVLDEVYSIHSENGNKFLRADNEGQFVQMFKRDGWSVKHNPYLSWKWRVIQHPKGANAMTKYNDTAVGVYVVYRKSLFSVRTVKYVWAADGKLEHVLRNRMDYPQITIRVGDDQVGQWVTEKRNIKKDYENLFGKEPGKAFAFGIITEADSVKEKKAIGDYDEFIALKK